MCADPSSEREIPFGAVTTTRLPVTKLRLSVTVPMGRFQMPAPAASLATDGPKALSLIRVFVTVSVPELAMPAPRANAHPSGPQGGSGGLVGAGSAVEGATVFRAITLSLMDTVAPVVSPSAGGIHTPPPSVNQYAGGLVVVRPPVTVTRLIETVGWVGRTTYRS